MCRDVSNRNVARRSEGADGTPDGTIAALGSDQSLVPCWLPARTWKRYPAPGSRPSKVVGLLTLSATWRTESPCRTCSDMAVTGVKSPAGTVQLTVRAPRPTYRACGAVGVLGAAFGMTAADGAEGSDSPTALRAV